MIRMMSLLISGCLLSGCSAHTHSLSSDPSLWESAVLTKTQTVAVGITKPPSSAHFISIDSEEVKQAFVEYQETGRAPIIDSKGFLQLPFDETEPVIYCQPLRSCNVSLQAGEKVTAVLVGDNARWKFIIAHSGQGDSIKPNVVFRPKYVGISTNAIITTTKRVYHLALLSKEDSYVRQIKFYYPNDIQAEMEALNQAAYDNAEQQQKIIVAEFPTINVDQLDFNYSINTKGSRSRKVRWVPQRIFNDGSRVFIQIPPVVSKMDAPVLFIFGRDGKQALANYRVHGDYYIVDTLFTQAMLVAGVGNHQENVVIQYKG